MCAAPKPSYLFVRKLADHLEQARIGAEEMLPRVAAGRARVTLPLAVDDFVHATA